jgi:hypothetical protein
MAWKIQDESPQVVLTLTGATVAGLTFVTWAMVRLSSWIVGHDEVWAKMDAEGKKTEHMLAAGFHALGGLLVWGVGVFGLVLLWLVWRAVRSQGYPGA